MGIINFIDNILSENNYRINKTNPGFLLFSTLKYYYNVEFSNQITTNIWLGNFIESANEDFIKKNNIKVIINCSKDLPFYFSQMEVPYRYRIPVNDDRQENSLKDMYLYLPSIIDKIKKHIDNNHNIYIHCHAGMQRSACVVCAYIMASHNMNFEDTYTYLKARRPIVFTPNINFKKSLESYYNNHLHVKNIQNVDDK
jgi:hypothetical protein